MLPAACFSCTLCSSYPRDSSSATHFDMSLVTLLDAHLAYGDTPLLDGARLSVLAGERIGLIGRNGTGKSTLLRVSADQAHLDDGELTRREGSHIQRVGREAVLPGASKV